MNEMKNYLQQRINDVNSQFNNCKEGHELYYARALDELEKTLAQFNSFESSEMQSLKEQMAYLKAELSMKHD